MEMIRTPFLRRPRPLPPRRPAHRSGEAGFSIIELMVALVLLGLGILSVANLFPLGSRTQVRDRLRTSAADVAQQKMEQLRISKWNEAVLDPGVHPDASGETIVLDDEGTFNRRWIVESQAGAFADMKKVTVRVIWSYQARPDTIDLVTYFRR
jgi:prepilin-type N-terminal cleavage/methylation domain-containing protein